MERDTKLITDNFIYFYHLDKFCILPMYPENVTDVLASRFTETTALARTAPVYSYANSGPRSVTVNLGMHRDLINDCNVNISNLKDNVVDVSNDDYVDTLVRYLQAANLPRYNSYNQGSNAIIPPMVAVKLGTGIFIKGVVESVTVDYEKPIMSDGKYAKVKVSFTIKETEPYDADKVVAEGSFRGISSTFKDGVFKSNTKGATTSKVQSKVQSAVRDEINRSKLKKKLTRY